MQASPARCTSSLEALPRDNQTPHGSFDIPEFWREKVSSMVRRVRNLRLGLCPLKTHHLQTIGDFDMQQASCENPGVFLP